MRFQLGMVGCLLAGCTLQPTTSNPRDAALALASAQRPVPMPTPPPPLVLRIGVEHLPPEHGEAVEPARIESIAPPVFRSQHRPGWPGRDDEGLQPASERPLFELATTDDPLANEALHFLSDLVEADRARVRREVGLPFFDFRGFDPDRGPLLNSEEALQTDHELWVQQHGTSLLTRPARQLLRRLPLVRDVEVAFDDFRSENVPLSEPYQNVHDRRQGTGRASLRVHADDLADPVELGWVWSGLRVGSSQEYGRFALDLPLDDALRLEVRSRAEYGTGEIGYRVDLSWRRSRSTSLHVAVGDDMDFLSTSSIYSLFESPMDGAPGLVLYAVHIF